MSVVPLRRISCSLTTWIGLVAVRFGCAMREPVTTTSVTGTASEEAAVCAIPLWAIVRSHKPAPTPRTADPASEPMSAPYNSCSRTAGR